MAVLVKSNGLLRNVYMAAIKPFRHLLVCPAMMRRLEQEWRAPVSGRPSTPEPGAGGRRRQRYRRPATATATAREP